MNKTHKELEALAIENIKSLFGLPEGEFSSTLFVSHHLEEIDETDWLAIFKTKQPTPEQILESLVLTDKWDSEEDGQINTFDFSLPENMTNYLLSVQFSEAGKVINITMES